MVWIFGDMNEWENGLLIMQGIKVWKYGRMVVSKCKEWMSTDNERVRSVIDLLCIKTTRSQSVI